MGYFVSSNLVLYAEEALFLANNDLAKIYYKKNLIPLPYLFQILSNRAKISLFSFTVYSELIKAGYILRRNKSNETNIEIKKYLNFKIFIKKFNKLRCIDLSYNIYSSIISLNYPPIYCLLILKLFFFFLILFVINFRDTKKVPYSLNTKLLNEIANDCHNKNTKLLIAFGDNGNFKISIYMSDSFIDFKI